MLSAPFVRVMHFGYFVECEYKDTNSVGRLTVREDSLYAYSRAGKKLISPHLVQP